MALGWGEPLVPWWGHPGFIGVPWWGGWGGPRVVNNVVINRTTVVNAATINVYRNASLPNAVVATRQDQFGRGVGAHVRIAQLDPHQLEPLRGKLPIQPAAASLTASLARAPRPPAAMLSRPVVATRAPYNPAPSLSAAGLKTAAKPLLAPRLVSAPQGPHPAFAAPRPPFGQQGHQLGLSSVPAGQTRQPNAATAPPPPPLERHAPTVHQLPGEPANRLYGAPSPVPVPHASSAVPLPPHKAPPRIRPHGSGASIRADLVACGRELHRARRAQRRGRSSRQPGMCTNSSLIPSWSAKKTA